MVVNWWSSGDRVVWLGAGSGAGAPISDERWAMGKRAGVMGKGPTFGVGIVLEAAPSGRSGLTVAHFPGRVAVDESALG